MSIEQRVFDKVTRHLLTQKEQSVTYIDDSPVCMYRGPKGLTCAVGCLITDEHYSPSIENLSSREQPVRERIAKSLDISYEQVPHWLLSDLQAMHDHVSPFFWSTELSTLAEKHELEFHPPLEPA